MSRLLSVVIPTFNGGNLFKRLVSSLKNQTLYPQMEVIIIDSGSCDETLHLSKEIASKVISIQQSDFNHGKTRNLGACLSDGKYIAFLTQDAIPASPDFFVHFIDSLERHHAAGGYARQIPRNEASLLVKREVTQWMSGLNERRVMTLDSMDAFLQLSPMERYFRCVFDNVAGLIRREVWQNLPFPVTPFGEDIEWGLRALCNGHTLVFEPDAVVEHSHERSPSYLYKRTFIDHYRLYELFGVRTVPAKRLAWRSWIQTTLNDCLYVLQNASSIGEGLRLMPDIPRNAWASAWGQYHGAKAAAMGKPVFQSKEV